MTSPGGIGGTGTYSITEADGTAYIGIDSATVTIDTWGSTNLNTQNTDTVTPALNTALKAGAGTATGPDVVWDVCAALVAPTDPSKWLPGATSDGIHMNSTGTALVVAKAVAENWYLALL